MVFVRKTLQNRGKNNTLMRYHSDDTLVFATSVFFPLLWFQVIDDFGCFVIGSFRSKYTKLFRSQPERTLCFIQLRVEMTLVLGTKMPWNEMTSISMGYYRAASWRSIRLIPANISVISGATKEQGSLFIAPLANRKLSRLNEGCKQNIKASVINHHDSYLFFQFLRIMLNKVLPVIYKVARVLKYVPSSHTYK